MWSTKETTAWADVIFLGHYSVSHPIQTLQIQVEKTCVCENMDASQKVFEWDFKVRVAASYKNSRLELAVIKRGANKSFN